MTYATTTPKPHLIFASVFADAYTVDVECIWAVQRTVLFTVPRTVMVCVTDGDVWLVVPVRYEEIRTATVIELVWTRSSETHTSWATPHHMRRSQAQVTGTASRAIAGCSH
jgi:hypothetical protein